MKITTDQDLALSVAYRLAGSPNKAMCRICKDVIESKHIHDWVSCKGGHIFIDGGKEYRHAGTLKEDVSVKDIIYCS